MHNLPQNIKERIEDLKTILDLNNEELESLKELNEEQQLGSLTLMAKMQMFQRKRRLH
ncbi:MAG: hypothetical protein KGJ31_03395 [Patescibacteria group bacterium]|nr:hypothetical protein [Patescibacteria group bacterium]